MRITLLFVTLLMFSVSSVFAQQPMKFGHINSDEIFALMPGKADVDKQLEAEYKKQEGVLGMLQEQLKQKQDDYMKVVKTLSKEDKAAREQELMEMNKKAQNFYLLAQQQLKAKEQELNAPLIKKLETIIQEVGDEQGFLFIFELNSGLPVYHSTKSIDIASFVKTKLGIQ